MRVVEAMKLLWSHSRDIHVEVRKNTIKYIIPTYSERHTGELGDFIRADKVDAFLHITYARKEPSVEIDKVAREPGWGKYWTNE